jgi:hypothetical protein
MVIARRVSTPSSSTMSAVMRAVKFESVTRVEPPRLLVEGGVLLDGRAAQLRAGPFD